MRTNLEAVLTKVRSTHNNIPGDHFTGWLTDKPSVGKVFLMETREVGKLWTTPVTTVRFISDGAVEFDTRNSTYLLEYVRRIEDGEELYITPLESEILSVFSSNGVHDSIAIIPALKALVQKLLGRSVCG